MYTTSEAIYKKLDKLYAAGKTSEAEQFLQTAFLMNHPENGNINSAFITSMYELGNLYRRIGKYQESIEWYVRLKELAQNFMGVDTFENGAVTGNLAETYRQAGDNEKAMYYFEETLRIFSKTEGMRSEMYITTLNSIILLLKTQKNYSAAIYNCEKAVSILKAMPGTEQEIANTYYMLIDLYMLAGDAEKARNIRKLAHEQIGTVLN